MFDLGQIVKSAITSRIALVRDLPPTSMWLKGDLCSKIYRGKGWGLREVV